MATDLEELAEQSTFVFAGTVQRLGAATLSAITPGEHTAIVKVDEVLRAPATLRDLAGQEITIQLQATPAASVGTQAVFFASPWLYGESVAVQEVGRRTASREVARAREYLASPEADVRVRALQQHLPEVAAVVVGQVSSTRPLHEAATGVSEHDPQWWEASLAVDAVHKGDVAPPSVAVLFPASLDVAWYHAPKLRVGEKGVWLLHRRPDELAPERYPQAFVVVDDLDALPPEIADTIQNLV